MVKRYLTLTSLEQALAILKSSFPSPGRAEKIPIIQSVGRIAAQPVYAKYSVPEANIAAMDGIAVRSCDTIGASDQAPVTLERFAQVNTGNIVPREFDAVIMIEDTWETGSRFQIRKSAAPNQHVRPAGEDIKENQLVLPSGHLIRAFDIGALATYGITHLEVFYADIGIIPTGSELVPLGVRPAPGQVVESNTIMAEVFLSAMGAHCTRYPIVRDDPDLIEEALRSAVRNNDFIIISAGSSAGTRDFTASVISYLGELLFHGVAIRPGKPVMVGKIEGKPVLGLPGYPLAAQTILREFAAPLLQTWGLAPPRHHTVSAKLTQAINSDPGFDDFVPVYVGLVGATCWGIPHSKGSGVQMATVRANGYAHIPAAIEGYDAGCELEIFLTTDPGRIDRTLILTGSYDPSVEDLANIVHGQGMFLHVSNVGNTVALLALRKNACHAAPLSLPAFSLMPECRVIMQHLPSGGLAFVNIATICQGIASRDGVGVDDLPGVCWINTKKDTSSRVLFDAALGSRGIDPSLIHGYTNELNGPRAVAMAICNGIADAGMCTAGVAEAADLQFVPVGQELYGLAVLPEMLVDQKVAFLVSVIRSPEYRKALTNYCGYDLSQTGMIHRIFNDRTIKEITPRDSYPQSIEL